MSEQVQVAPVATNTPFDYNENLVISVGVSDIEKAIEWYQRRARARARLQARGVRLVRDGDRHEAGVTIGLGQTEE